MRKQKGFSLIELLIVVAIMLIIAAIAIPNLLRARMSANESAAASSIRTINTAQVSYVTATCWRPMAVARVKVGITLQLLHPAPTTRFTSQRQIRSL